jgi:hypothetical protein
MLMTSPLPAAVIDAAPVRVSVMDWIVADDAIIAPEAEDCMTDESVKEMVAAATAPLNVMTDPVGELHETVVAAPTALAFWNVAENDVLTDAIEKQFPLVMPHVSDDDRRVAVKIPTDAANWMNAMFATTVDDTICTFCCDCATANLAKYSVAVMVLLVTIILLVFDRSPLTEYTKLRAVVMVDDVTEMVTKSVTAAINKKTSNAVEVMVLDTTEITAFPTLPVNFAVDNADVVMVMLVIESRSVSTVPRVSKKF